MTTRPPYRASWRKSSRSGNGGENCVEVAHRDPSMAFRDSKNRSGAILEFAPGPWSGFMAAVKGGRFDA